MRTGVQFGYFPPDPRLKPFIKHHFYATSGGRNPGVHSFQVYPELGMTWVHLFGGNWSRLIGDARYSSINTSYLIRPTDESRWLEVDGEIDFFGTVFRPEYSSRLTALSIKEMPFAIAPEDAWGHGTRLLHEELGEEKSNWARKERFEAFILRQLNPGNEKPDPYILALLREIQRKRGNLQVTKLAGFSGLSCRQIERKFGEHIGLSPKSIIRIERFNQVAHFVSRKAPENWAGFAMDFGYYDQSHLISDFQKFTGVSPQRFVTLGGVSHFSNPHPGAAGK